MPPCPEKGVKHNCYGKMTLYGGRKYEGDFKDEKFHGMGTYTFVNGAKYVGEFQFDKFHGHGIEYLANGSVNRSGRWENDNLVQSIALYKNRFPFNPPIQSEQLQASLETPDLRSLPWKDRLDRVVETEL